MSLVATIGGKRLELVRADLTKQTVDAIVTAANRTLSGGNQAGFGGGVDGAIHRAAGPGLLEECLAIGGCEPGDAVITGPANMNTRHIIHAVGPIYGDHNGEEDTLLASAHRRSLELAEEHGCESVAFPAISCGVYKHPIDRAALVALRVILEHLAGSEVIRTVRYCLFSEADLSVFAAALRTLTQEDPRITLQPESSDH